MKNYRIEYTVTDHMQIKGLDMESAIEVVRDDVAQRYEVYDAQITIGAIKEID